MATRTRCAVPESPGARNNRRWRELIAEREDFVNGNRTLEALFVDGLTEEDAVGLTGVDLERFVEDAPFIVYVVLSYSTPIHWVTAAGFAYTIATPMSKTTAGHRNLCPGYAPTRGDGWTVVRGADGKRRRIRRETT